MNLLRYQIASTYNWYKNVVKSSNVYLSAIIDITAVQGSNVIAIVNFSNYFVFHIEISSKFFLYMMIIVGGLIFCLNYSYYKNREKEIQIFWEGVHSKRKTIITIIYFLYSIFSVIITVLSISMNKK